jgi:nucleoside-specific outer membrane channel protein Tsx
MKSLTRNAVLFALLFGCSAAAARAQSVQEIKPAPNPPDAKSTVEIFGFVMLDLGHDFTQIDPNWIDTMRVSRLPKVADEFGLANRTFASARQTRFGVRSATPTDAGKLSTLFEFNMLGVGVDAGQTTLRLRHAWGELGAVGAGQTWSVFTDPDSAPKAIEPMGPTGLAWYRNIQVRWTPISGASTVQLAIERPGGSADDGIYAERIEVQDITPRFPFPDVTAAYKRTTSWGHVRVAGLLRRINWDDMREDAFDLSGHATGWGLNLSTVAKPSQRDVIRAAVAYGEGIQNYLGDAPVDIGIINNFANPVTPIVGTAVPVIAFSGFLEHTWSDRFNTTFGYSLQDNDNAEAQSPTAFHRGHYALGNLQYQPNAAFSATGEVQWGRRVNFSDGFQSDGLIAHFAIRYNFSWQLGG